MDASAAQPALAAAPVRNPRGKVLVLAGAILCLLALGLLLPRLLPKPAAKITIGPLSPIAYLEKGDAFGKDSVQVIVRFYENDRIDDKIVISKSRRMLPGAMITMIWRTTRPSLPPAPMKAARRASIASAKAAITRPGKCSKSFRTPK